MEEVIRKRASEQVELKRHYKGYKRKYGDERLHDKMITNFKKEELKVVESQKAKL